jgi:hypothetical protein
MDPTISDLTKTLIGLGPGGLMAGLMFYLYRDEKAERRDLQQSSVQLLRDKITSDNALAAALDKIADRVKG